MEKIEVVSLTINDRDIPFLSCIATISKESVENGEGEGGETTVKGNIGLFFQNSDAAACLAPFRRKRVTVRFSTDAETHECSAYVNDTMRFDRRAACYLLI